MSTLRTLHDAFEELEHRADAALRPAAAEIPAQRPTRRHARRLLAPAAAAAAVALIAAGVTVWRNAGSGAPTEQRAAQSIAPTSSPTATPPPAPGRFQPPTTPAQLAAKTRAILAGIATITVTDTGDPARGTAPQVHVNGHASTPSIAHQSSPPADGGSGSAIVGTLTASGRSGGFALNVFRASRGATAMCDADTDCSVHHRPDGSTLALGSWHDRSVPGGTTYQVEVIRPDGADILLHLSTERDPKGESTVTASRVPLTIDQMIDFVTSDRW